MSNQFTRRGALTLPLLTALALSGCVAARPASTTAIDPKNAVVGISMPTKSLERWNRDGSNLNKLLTDAGYRTSLQYADNKPDMQFSQIQNMVNDGVDVLVIAPIDGTMLAPAIEAAKAKNIPVLSYDRLIEGTDGIDYYVSFDNRTVGTFQGKFLVDQLKPNPSSPKNVELFGGSPDDPNAAQFFGGAWDILAEHFESGAFTSPSGKVPKNEDGWKQIGILGWDSAKAQSEMQTRLNSFYADGKKLDAVLSPNDSLALGIEQALEARGFRPGQNWPVVTGQDGDKANVMNMLKDKQAMTVFKDTRELGERAFTMVDQIIKAETVEISKGKEYDNGKKKVPTFLLTPKVVTKDTVKKDLVDTGFYTAEELGA
ncbi:sugar-binding protein [Helcobacillus massiliensis]|uniref:substrate-binding domain-containing protein n=1 Tax=Helcobacillus massiliensis TaxID=521392 RepID=UPI0021A51BAC|nr:sugar-binding protein [Helcobacillus massiliensis]MCT1557586.1 sugar-binding protein [Helcobacillus massiliensis]MCT2036811.1 sugar-binding protein [Helcobacillus massiliensis]MCT2332436.1 sugar-binding protein [Helcobacillus massiliensis]